MFNKKGDIWVSTVIYIALSIIVLTIVLVAALPVIHKLKDRNVTIQTKNILIQIDKNIREIVSSGPGSKRVLSPVIIDAGILNFDIDNSVINWTLKTTDDSAESGILRQEGNVFVIVNQRVAGGSIVEGEFEISQYLSYEENPAIEMSLAVNSLRPPFTGRFTMTIRHTGTINTNKVLVPKLEFNLQ